MSGPGSRRARGRARRIFLGAWAIARGGRALAAPFVVYPVFLMNVLCMALFASAFNLLLGYTGLLSFGHAAFLGSAGYVTGHAAQGLGLPPDARASWPGRRWPRCSASSSAAWPSAAPASTSP